MIDFSLRNKRIIEEAENKEVAVILLDVVLGYGSHMDPASELVPVIRKALEISPKHYKILFNKGVILNKLNKIEDSKEYYKKSIIENPKYPYSFLNLSVIYREEGNFEKAIEVINEGIKENQEQGFLYYNRACFYVNIKENLKAFKDVEKSIKLDDLFLDYMKKDRELDPIRELEEYKKFNYISNKK
jgi:tetratricopeptide (TPR) repeat protein